MFYNLGISPADDDYGILTFFFASFHGDPEKCEKFNTYGAVTHYISCNASEV